MNATSDLLDFAAAAHRIPDAARGDTVRLLGDTLAVGAAGATAPGAEAVLCTARAFGEGNDSRLIGVSERLPAPSAAFVNGYRIHCLEWDAVHEVAVVHALSVVTAALGATIDRRGGCDADAALTALAVGVDIACGFGVAATSPLSFFRPATAGLIGAALAVARIEQLPREQFADVLGIAYSSCAGTMQAHVEGSIALPFQIANAARAAVVAVDVVRAGFTGPHDALEGPFGYFKLIDTGDLSAYTRDLGHVWRMSEISTKPYPSGRASHATLSALVGLNLDPASIERIEVFVPPLVMRLVRRPFRHDMTPSYARLCLPLLVALVLTDGAIDPRRFEPATFADPAILALADRVIVSPDDNADPNALSPQRIRVTTTDGTVVDHSVPDTLGSPAAPMSPGDQTAKRELIATLTGDVRDPRLFDDPLSYFTEPK